MSRTAPARRARAVARPLLTALLAALVVLCHQLPTSPAFAAGYVKVSGAGSTWSQNALDQWRANVKQYGMTVNYSGTGSSDGRNQFRNGTVDFAVSEIPYGIKDNGVVDQPPPRRYAYMPIVAGGTAFMYNLRIAGKRVTNLRLSGQVIAKIFTGGIRTWNDPAIKADNPGLAAALPARRIVPVVRSDGSGTTAQFTTWLADRHGGIWDAYCKRAGVSTMPCGTTSNYPTASGLGFVAQSGSSGVAGYVAGPANVGTITYVEYSYAKETTGFPVAKVLNENGYYVEPTASNVAVALTHAQIETDRSSPRYLTQKLHPVYTQSTDPRVYPLSSYSYMIVPTAVENNFSEAKGRSLGAFAYYFLCEGQRNVDDLGYSPLPVNLVKAGFEQVKKIPGVDAQRINLQGCRNPTFSSDGTNTLARTAPRPPACDKKGPTQCSTGTGGATQPTQVNGSGGGNGGSGGGSSNGGSATGGSSGGGSTTGADGGGTGGADGGGTDGGSATGAIDPDTGLPVNGADTGGGSQDGGGEAFAVPVTTSAAISGGLRTALMVIGGVLLVGLTFGPPLLARRLKGGQR
ncbi:phosphate ABC transporter substrate-binding protein PstS [Streptomyces polyrhachis]|uniref:Phosphate ABC transporter substrate-binding protein PstS n=1 Tax=Streptomyces polyrhachis TaxID=1282885 RepID=A0ABW2GGW0_9ACTN